MEYTKLIDYINQSEEETEFEVGDQHIDEGLMYFYSKNNYEEFPLAKWIADNCNVIKSNGTNLVINLFDVIHDNIDILKNFANEYYKDSGFLQETIDDGWDNDDWVADFVEDFSNAVNGYKSEKYENAVIKALREGNLINLTNQLKEFSIVGTHGNEVFNVQEKFELEELLKSHPNVFKLSQLVENLNSDWSIKNYQFQLVKNSKSLEL